MTAQRFDDEIEYTNGADPTRKARFDFQQVRSGAKRTYSFPDTNLDFSSHFDFRKSGTWQSAFGSSTMMTLGMPAAIAVGTHAALPEPFVDGPGRLVSRIRIPTTTVAGNVAGIYANAHFLRATPTDGYIIRQRWMRADPAAVAGSRSFVGIGSQTGNPTNVEPDTLINSIGIAQLSTNATRYYLIVSGAIAQAATLLDAPIYLSDTPSALNGIPYEFEVIGLENTTYRWTLRRLDLPVELGGVITGTDDQRPAQNVSLRNRAWVTNTAAALEARMEYFDAHHLRLATW